MSKKAKKSLARKLAAYSLAGGAVALASQAVPAAADVITYDNGGAGWYDATSDWEQDILSFKMDGTVVVNDTDIGPLPDGLAKDADTFTFQERNFYWWGTEQKDATCLNIGENVGYVAGYGDVWNVGRLGGGYVVGDALEDGRVWSDRAVTDTGGLGGWNFYFAGEWAFGGSGYVGLYADDEAGRHYGWADVTMTAYFAIELHEFGFSDQVDTPVEAGGGEYVPIPEPTALGLLALGAVGLAARRRKRA